jgi:Zn-dependent membrane protease YugP
VRAPDSTVGDHYQRSGLSYDEVFLLGRTPDSCSIVAHEIGHAIMDDIYEDCLSGEPRTAAATRSTR